MNAGRVLALAAMITAVAGAAQAQVTSTATQSVSFEVKAINVISFAGSPVLTVSTATPGSDPTPATAAATWAVTTNQPTAKISAVIDANMPSGVTLSVNLTAPTAGGTSTTGTLSTTSVDLVTGIPKTAQGGLAVGYTLSATAAAGVVASTSRTVTYTITGGL